MFNIAATKYNLSERAFEIYVSGCRGNNGVHCKDCHNPALWSENHGAPWTDYEEYIRRTVISSGNLVSSIRIYGGEPLEKEEEDLVQFLSFISSLEKEIWLFTRFPLEDVSQRILDFLDYIKCGAYIPEEKLLHEEYGVMLATANQHIYKAGEDYIRRAEDD